MTGVGRSTATGVGSPSGLWFGNAGPASSSSSRVGSEYSAMLSPAGVFGVGGAGVFGVGGMGFMVDTVRAGVTAPS